MSLPKDMRLQVVVHRNDLPDVYLVWAVNTRDKLKISDLVSQINDVVPLESKDWGLEDYVVELPSADGSPGFEFLHYQLLDSVLKSDDKIAIRPLQTDDLQRRRLSGRVQINSNGKRLIDGVAFGRSWLVPPSDRPNVRIPPRKRQRLAYRHSDAVADDEQPRLLLEDEPTRRQAQEPARGQVALSKEVVENSDDDSDVNADSIKQKIFERRREEASKRNKTKGPGARLDKYASRASPNHSARRQFKIPGPAEMEDVLTSGSSPPVEDASPITTSSDEEPTQREVVDAASRKAAARPADTNQDRRGDKEEDDDMSSDGSKIRSDGSDGRASGEISDNTSSVEASDRASSDEEISDEGRSDEETSDSGAHDHDTSDEDMAEEENSDEELFDGDNPDDATSESDVSPAVSSSDDFSSDDSSSNASESDSDNDAPVTVSSRALADPKSQAAPAGAANATKNKRPQMNEATGSNAKNQNARPQAPQVGAEAASSPTAASKPLTKSQKRNLRRRLNRAASACLKPASQAPQGLLRDTDHDDLTARKQALLSSLNSSLAQSHKGDTDNRQRAPVPGVPADGDHAQEIPENWPSLINYNAAECTEDGVHFCPAPFPFEKWWHQKQNESHGSAETTERAHLGKRKRDSDDEFAQDATTAVGHGRGDIDAYSNETIVLNYDDPEPTQAPSVKDSDDFPSLPLNLDALSEATRDTIAPDMVITWKQLSLSSTYQPVIASVMATVLAAEDDGAKIHVRLAKRDREGTNNKYDADGSRIYRGLDAPDLDSDADEDDGLRDLILADLYEARIVSAPAKLPETTGAANMHDGKKANKAPKIASAAEIANTAAKDAVRKAMQQQQQPQQETSVAAEVDDAGTVLLRQPADTSASTTAQVSTTTGTLRASRSEEEQVLRSPFGERVAFVSAIGEGMEAAKATHDQTFDETIDSMEEGDSNISLSPPSMLLQEMQAAEAALESSNASADLDMINANDEVSSHPTLNDTAHAATLEAPGEEMPFSTALSQRYVSSELGNGPSRRRSDPIEETLPAHSHEQEINDGDTTARPGSLTPKARFRQHALSSSSNESISDGESLPSLQEIIAYASQRSPTRQSNGAVSEPNTAQQTSSEFTENNSDDDTEYFDAESSKRNPLPNATPDHRLNPLATVSRASRSLAIATKHEQRDASTPAKKARRRASGLFVVPAGSQVISILDDSPTSTPSVKSASEPSGSVASAAVVEHAAGDVAPTPASQRSTRSTPAAARSPIWTARKRFKLQRQFILDEPTSISSDDAIRSAIAQAFPRTPMSLFTFFLEGHPLPKKWLVQLHSEPIGACLKLEIATDNPDRPWPAKLEQVRGPKCPFCEQRRHADPAECKWLKKDLYVSGAA